MSTATAEHPPIPDVAQQQQKTIDSTAASFFKGGMGLALKNLMFASKIGHRNADRFMRNMESKDGKGQPSDGVREPAKSEDDMRIDSDDIHYHLTPSDSAPAPTAGGTLAKLAGTALLATGIGAPLGIGLMMAPEIIRAWKGVESAVVSPITPPVAPADQKTDPVFGKGGVQLSLEPDKDIE